MSKHQTKWTKHLMAVYHELKRKDKNTTLSEAMKVAKISYRK